MNDTEQKRPGVAVYSSTSGPRVYLSPTAVNLAPQAQAQLMRQAALALRTEAKKMAVGGRR